MPEDDVPQPPRAPDLRADVAEIRDQLEQQRVSLVRLLSILADERPEPIDTGQIVDVMRKVLDPAALRKAVAEEVASVGERVGDATTSMHELGELVREAMQRVSFIETAISALPTPDDLSLLRGQMRAALREEREASEQRLLQTQATLNSLATKVNTLTESLQPLRTAVDKLSGRLEETAERIDARADRSAAHVDEQLSAARARIDSLGRDLAAQPTLEDIAGATRTELEDVRGALEKITGRMTTLEEVRAPLEDLTKKAASMLTRSEELAIALEKLDAATASAFATARTQTDGAIEAAREATATALAASREHTAAAIAAARDETATTIGALRAHVDDAFAKRAADLDAARADLSAAIGKVADAIAATQDALRPTIDDISDQIGALPARLASIEERVSALPDRLGAVERSATALPEKIGALEARVAALPSPDEAARSVGERVTAELARARTAIGEDVTAATRDVSERLQRLEASIEGAPQPATAEQISDAVGRIERGEFLLAPLEAIDQRLAALSSQEDLIERNRLWMSMVTDHLTRLEEKIDARANGAERADVGALVRDAIAAQFAALRDDEQSARSAARSEDIERLTSIASEVRESLGGLEAIWQRLSALEASMNEVRERAPRDEAFEADEIFIEETPSLEPEPSLPEPDREPELLPGPEPEPEPEPALEPERIPTEIVAEADAAVSEPSQEPDEIVHEIEIPARAPEPVARGSFSEPPPLYADRAEPRERFGLSRLRGRRKRGSQQRANDLDDIQIPIPEVLQQIPDVHHDAIEHALEDISSSEPPFIVEEPAPAEEEQAEPVHVDDRASLEREAAWLQEAIDGASLPDGVAEEASSRAPAQRARAAGSTRKTPSRPAKTEKRPSKKKISGARNGAGSVSKSAARATSAKKSVTPKKSASASSRSTTSKNARTSRSSRARAR